MGTFHVVIEGALSHVLDVFIDRHLQILPGLRLVRNRSKHPAASIHCGEHAAGYAVEAGIVFLLETAEAVVIEADVAQAPARRSDYQDRSDEIPSGNKSP